MNRRPERNPRTPEMNAPTPFLLRRPDFASPREDGSLKQSLPVRFVAAHPLMADGSLDDNQRILRAADAILEQGEDLLRALTRNDYTRRLPLVFNASLGGHYRHCLDHFTSFFRGVDGLLVDYDDRDRDARIENDPQFALEQTQCARARLAGLPAARLNTELMARCEVSYAAGRSPAAPSSLGRELIYVIAHAVHHYAFISVMAGLLGVKLPAHFGVAPSTVAHLNKTDSSAPPPNGTARAANGHD